MIAVAALFVSGCSEEHSVDEFFESAEQKFESEDYRGAIPPLQTVLTNAPDHVPARILLGRIHLLTFNGAAAEKEFERAIEHGAEAEPLEPGILRAILLQGQVARMFSRETEQTAERASRIIATGKAAGEPFESLDPDQRATIQALYGHGLIVLRRLGDARTRYERALELSPQNAEARLGMARLAGFGGDRAAMRERLVALVELHPEFADAYSSLGDLERAENRPEAAVQAYDAALEHRPFPLVLDRFKRTEALAQGGKLEQARQELEALQGLGWQHPGVQTGLARVAFLEGDADAALKLAREALSANPGYRPALLVAGAASYESEASEQAQDYLSRYLSGGRGASSAFFILASIQLQRGDIKAASKTIAQYRRAYPDAGAAIELEVITQLSEGKHAEALQTLEKRAQEQTQSELSRVKLAIGREVAGQADKGVEDLKEAFEGNPDSVIAARFYFDRLLRAREVDRAMEVALRLVREQPDNAAAATLLGMAYTAKRDLPEARKAFTRALELDPEQIEARRGLALLARHGGDDQALKAQREEILGKDPGHLESLLDLARMHAREGRPDEAEALLVQAVAKNPGSVLAALTLADFQDRRQQHDEAIKTLVAALKENPDEPRLLSALGKAYLATGRANQAIGTLQRLVQRLPDSALSHFLLARAAAAAGDVLTAEGALSSALERNPEFGMALQAMARLQIKTGRYDEAAATLERLQSVRPDDAETSDIYAELATAKGDTSLALRRAEEAFRRTPSASRAVRLAAIQAREGLRRESLATLEAWLAKEPEDVSVLSALAGYHTAVGDSAAAIAVYERLLALRPDDPSILNNLAWALRDSDPKRGLELAERARRQTDDHPATVDTHAMLLLAIGEQAKALSMLEEIVRRTPQVPVFRYHLALALSESGKAERARGILDELLSSDQAFVERAEAEKLRERLR